MSIIIQELNMQQVNIPSWATFKELLQNKALLLQYAEVDDTYLLYAAEAGVFLWHTSLMKDSGEDVCDFETNYKAIANQPLEVKATAGAPLRTVATAQPRNTTEKWKGYSAEMTAEETEKTILINFPIEVWLRGGSIFSDDAQFGDHITVDVVWTEYTALIIYPNLLENIFMRGGVPIPFVSSECMKFPPMLSLQITYHKVDDSKVRYISAIANFFEPPQL
jgi:hypothetical protein